MSFRRYASLFLLTVLLSACSEQEAPFDPEVVSSDVLAMLSEYASAANSGDLDAALGFYVQDSRFRWAEDGAIRYSSFADLEVAIRRFADYADFSTEYRVQRSLRERPDPGPCPAVHVLQNNGWRRRCRGL